MRSIILLVGVLLVGIGCAPKPVARPDIEELTAGFELQMQASNRVMPLIEQTQRYLEARSRWPGTSSDLRASGTGEGDPFDPSLFSSITFAAQQGGGLVLNFTLLPFPVEVDEVGSYQVREAQGTVVFTRASEEGEPEAEVSWTRFVAQRDDGTILDLSY